MDMKLEKLERLEKRLATLDYAVEGVVSNSLRLWGTSFAPDADPEVALMWRGYRQAAMDLVELIRKGDKDNA